MEGFNVGVPAAHGFIVGTIEGDLVPLGVGDDACFFMEETVRFELGFAVFGVAVRFEWNGNSDVENVVLD